MLIIGKTPLTERLYRGHIAEEYAKSYAVNIRNRFQAGAIHMVVTNYAQAQVRLFTTSLWRN